MHSTCERVGAPQRTVSVWFGCNLNHCAINRMSSITSIGNGRRLVHRQAQRYRRHDFARPILFRNMTCVYADCSGPGEVASRTYRGSRTFWTTWTWGSFEHRPKGASGKRRVARPGGASRRRSSIRSRCLPSRGSRLLWVDKSPSLSPHIGEGPGLFRQRLRPSQQECSVSQLACARPPSPVKGWARLHASHDRHVDCHLTQSAQRLPSRRHSADSANKFGSRSRFRCITSTMC